MKGKMGGLNGRGRNIKTEMPRFDPRSLLFLKESEIRTVCAATIIKDATTITQDSSRVIMTR